MPVTNCLSIDVEGFVEAYLNTIPIPEDMRSKREGDREIETNMEFILALLDKHKVRATFFFLGRIGEDLPEVVRRTREAGHEVGCHGWDHQRIYQLEPERFREMLRRAKSVLEDSSGSPVIGFRAADFSITDSSLWALDILIEEGFRYDSSIYPIGMHDVYGIKDAQPGIHRHANGLYEFPLAVKDVLGRRIPFGGGGYFRLYPVALTRALMKSTNRKGAPCMFYLHPYEVGPVIPRVPGLPALRRFRHYYNVSGGGPRLEKIIGSFPFEAARSVIEAQDPSAGEFFRS